MTITNPNIYAVTEAQARLTEHDLRAMLKADLVEIAVVLLDNLHVQSGRLGRAVSERDEARAKLAELNVDLGHADGRAAALEEALAHERARVDVLAGTDLAPRGDGIAWSPPSLTGDELTGALDALNRVLAATRRTGHLA